jgi:hypothetical protein
MSDCIAATWSGDVDGEREADGPAEGKTTTVEADGPAEGKTTTVGVTVTVFDWTVVGVGLGAEELLLQASPTSAIAGTAQSTNTGNRRGITHIPQRQVQPAFWN